MPSSPDEFRRSYLIGAHFIPESVEIGTLFEQADGNRMVEEALPDGRYMRVRSGLYKPRNPVPVFWEGKVQDITLYEKSHILGSRILYSHIRLDPYWVITGELWWTMRTHINALFASICGRSEVTQYQYVEPSVLYVQGHHGGLIDDNDPFIKSLSRVGVEYNRMTGAWIAGTLFTPGLGGSNEWKSVSAYDSCPDSMHSWADAIPVVVCDLVEFQAIIEILSRSIDLGYTMPFARRTAQSYIQNFLAARTKNGILEAYESLLLRDREKNLDRRLEIRRALHEIDNLLKQNMFHALYEHAEPKLSLNEELSWLGRIQSQVVGKYQEYRQLTEEILLNSETREIAVSELLRDRAVAESTKSNLRLQKMVLYLTIIAAIPVIPIVYSGWVKVSPYVHKGIAGVQQIVSKIHIHKRVR